MNPELLKRWESLTSAAAGDARAAARWGKLRRMLGVASASLLFAFVALTLVNAAAGLTVALLVLGVASEQRGRVAGAEAGGCWHGPAARLPVSSRD